MTRPGKPWVGGAIVVVLLAPLTGSSRASGAADGGAVPGPAVLAALDRLDQPSHPSALVEDQQVTADRWAHHGSCASLQSAYAATHAPLPLGATLTNGPFGSLVVDAPFGPNGIFVDDQTEAGRCVYGIATEPTVSISGPGIALTDRFLPVGCVSIFGKELVLTQFDLGGVVTTTVAAPSESGGWKVTVVPLPAAQAVKLSDVPAGSIEADGTGTFDGTTLVFEGTGTSGPVSAHLTCTPFTKLTTGGP